MNNIEKLQRDSDPAAKQVLARIMKRAGHKIPKPEPKARIIGRLAYAEARKSGLTPEESAQAAWMAIRKANGRLRAPRWGEAIDTNNPQGRRDYRIPLGSEMEAPLNTWGLGSHAGKWRRTQKSYREMADAQGQLLDWLEEGAPAGRCKGHYNK